MSGQFFMLNHGSMIEVKYFNNDPGMTGKFFNFLENIILISKIYRFH